MLEIHVSIPYTGYLPSFLRRLVPITNLLAGGRRFDPWLGKCLKSQKRPTRKVFVYKIEVNPIHTILKYGNYYDFMDR